MVIEPVGGALLLKKKSLVNTMGEHKWTIKKETEPYRKCVLNDYIYPRIYTPTPTI